MELINPELIVLDLAATDWKDAILQAAAPLVANGMITAGYAQKIIEISEETGPYIVITPHVALAHAPIEAGALKDAIGLAVLKEPVKFGNQDNDPVKYIFTLSSTQNGGHLDQMAALVNLLGMPEFFATMDRAKEPKEITNFINKNLEGV